MSKHRSSHRSGSTWTEKTACQMKYRPHVWNKAEERKTGSEGHNLKMKLGITRRNEGKQVDLVNDCITSNDLDNQTFLPENTK